MVAESGTPERKTSFLPADSEYMRCAEGESSCLWGEECVPANGRPKYIKTVIEKLLRAYRLPKQPVLKHSHIVHS